MAARRADAETNGSAGAAPLSAAGNHDFAPHSACFHDLREALQVVIGSVDKLRDEILPDICGKLRNIESSTHGAASRAPSEADTEGASPRTGPSSKQLSFNKMGPRRTLAGPSGASRGEKHAHDQTGELRDVVMGLHEHFEERMQAMYQQHSERWEERLQALLGEAHHREPQRMPTFLSRPSKSGLAIAAKNQSPCIGHWRDLRGEFWYGTTIVIGEEGWHPLEAGMQELEPDAAKPVEFLSGSKCKLLLPAGEENSQGAPLDVEIGPDDTLIATPMDGTQDGASYTLSRMVSRRRPMRISTSPDGESGMRLLTPGKPLKVRNLTNRFASAVNLDGVWLESSAKLHLRKKKDGRLGIFLTKRYEVAQVVMIVLDAIVLAWRTQYAAEVLAREPYESATRGIRDDVVLVLLNDLFCLWVTLDLVGRALAEGKYFFRSGVWALHSFEVFVVVAYILEAIAVHAHYDEGSKSSFRVWVGFVSFARTLRLLRIVHMSKLVRHNSAFRELRMMMYALQGAMKSLACSSVMLVVTLFISGTIFTNGYLRHMVLTLTQKDPPDGKQPADLKDAFGTLFASMFTLAKAVTGGTDWGEVYALLEPMFWPYKLFYVLFQIFATLALLNVITAVFVESTMQTSTRDRESAVVDEISSRRELLMKINSLFEEFDEDNDGQIKKEELKAHMQSRHIAAYFSSLGVDVDQVGKLFLLLDQDNSGTIDKQEFMSGCLRLKGEAKSVDLAVLQSDVNLLLEDIEDLSELMRVSMGKMDFMLESRVAV